MSETKSKNTENGYLFTLDVLVRGATNGQALEKLVSLLNNDEMIDYRIVKGINLGQVIETALQLSKDKEQPVVSSPKSKSKTTVSKPDYYPLIEQIEQYKDERRLVRLSILKGKGVKLDIPCRILNHDPTNGNITVYHVDEKKVYTYRINEIDDLNI